MTNVELLQLDLKDFKGIKKKTFKTNGENTLVLGENETGKSSLIDAHMWLCTNKNRLGQSPQKFDIKPLDEDNNPIHFLETEVKGVYLIDGKKIKLKKVYYEDWQKVRGSSEKKFKGHTTDYYFNDMDISINKSEYDKRLAEIIDPKLFKMLTSLTYFNEQIHWKKRRSMLVDVCGDINQEDIFDKNADLEQVKDFVPEERTVEDHKDVVKDKIGDINEKMDKLPVRIDEANNNLPDVSKLDEGEIKQKIEQLKEEKKELNEKINSINSDGEIADKNKKVAEIETELINLKNEYNADRLEKIQQLKEELSQNQNRVQELISKKSKLMKEQKKKRQQIEELEQKNQQLRKDWGELDEEADELRAKAWDGETECPTCGQQLPQEKIEEAKKKFHKDKSDRLEEIAEDKQGINEEGQANAKRIEALESEIEELQGRIDDLNEEKEEIQPNTYKLQNQIKKLKKKKDQEPELPEYSAKKAQKRQLENQIKQMKEDNEASLDKSKEEIKNQIDQLENKIESENKKLNKIEQYEDGQERIEELKAKEERLSAKCDELERQKYLCEEYIKTKVSLLEEKVNDKFQFATFKLFEEQINGGIKEVCQTVYDGVPYDTGLNDGGKINVGLDVINTFQEHYGMRLPVFVDNAESVTDFKVDMDTQVIKMKASEDHEELTVILESEFVNDDLGVTELRNIASALNIRNYSNYNKTPLIREINKAIILNGKRPDLEEVA